MGTSNNLPFQPLRIGSFCLSGRLERGVAAISDLLIKFVPREKIGLEFFIEILLNSFEFSRFLDWIVENDDAMSLALY